jgi:hypothetical protein
MVFLLFTSLQNYKQITEKINKKEKRNIFVCLFVFSYANSALH